MSIKKELAALPTEPHDLRKFALVVGGVFLALGAFALYRDAGWAPIPLWIGGPLVTVGVVYPKVLRPVYLGWMGLAFFLGTIVTGILLTVFFFVVITPVALFFKLIGRDALHRKLDREAESYWIVKEYPIPDRTRFEKFF